MNVKDCTIFLRRHLSSIYGEGEAKAMVRLIFHHLKGWSQTDLIINEDREVSDYTLSKIKGILSRLENHEPLQYILGEAHFYGMNLKVDRSTLIPRPETAELVDLIIHRADTRPDLRVLDIGTGSGAIAIALSRFLRFPIVKAIDFSKDALTIAEENARNLKARVSFVEADVFTYSPSPVYFDIIVSNPPYIDESEKAGMERNVLDFEPSSALFVPDDNPLVFYSRISTIAAQALVHKGQLYLEINPRHAEEMRALLENDGFISVELIKDTFGQQRFAIATKE